MSKSRIIKVSILLIITVVLVWNTQIITLFKAPLPIKTYTFREGKYISSKDFAPGIYDIYARQTNMELNGFKLSPNERVSSYQIEKGFSVEALGDGMIELIPNDLSKKIVSNEGMYFLEQGNCFVPNQIDPGEYILKLGYDEEFDKDDAKLKSLTAVVYIDDRKGMGVSSTTLNYKKEKSLKLENGYVMYVCKVSDGCMPYLEKVK